jgi:DDE superfamily endonuclease
MKVRHKVNKHSHSLPYDSHGLKFQAVSLPIGLCVLHGPLLGPDHDSTILRMSSLEQHLAEMTARRRLVLPLAEPYCVYGDTAYYESEHVRRATQYTVSTPQQRALNDVYKPLRVLVEQQFACISQLHGIVRVQLSLGTGPTGMVYPVCALLANIHTLIYGNCVSASVPGAELLLTTLSLETYLRP